MTAIRIWGDTFDPELDGHRLKTMFEKVRRLMADGQWRTAEEVCNQLGFHPRQIGTISRRLRDLRSSEVGWIVDTRRRGDPKRGIWEYRATAPDDAFKVQPSHKPHRAMLEREIERLQKRVQELEAELKKRGPQLSLFGGDSR